MINSRHGGAAGVLARSAVLRRTSMMSRVVAFGSIGLVAMAACTSEPATVEAPVAETKPVLPPRVCKPAAGPARSGSWFTDVTAEVGLAPTDALNIPAVSLIAADLDGDGFADLVTMYGGATRGAPKEGP